MDKEQIQYLNYIMRQNNVIIEQLNALTKSISNHLNLAIEEGVEDIET